ncbi:hypothetical protein LINPERHAP2_LOCUS15667 [Linum perenne]
MQQTAATESPSDRRSKAVALSRSVALAVVVLRPPSPSPSFPAAAPSSDWARRRGYLKNRTRQQHENGWGFWSEINKKVKNT